MEWSYFDQYEEVVEKYMPTYGEGESIASQAVTAVNKLIYKWYNDGDVYDNRFWMKGWCNDLSSYANWLAQYTGDVVADGLRYITDKKCNTDEEYEMILVHIAELILGDEKTLEEFSHVPKQGSIYDCKGEFEFVEEEEEEEEEEEYYDDEEEEW